MRLKINILILLFSVMISVTGQNLDKKYIDNWISTTFLNTAIDSQTVYILNGLLIDKTKIDFELSKYKRLDLTIIDFVDRVTIDSSIFCQRSSGIVLLGTKEKQTKKSLYEDFDLAKSKFKKDSIKIRDFYSNSEPVLIINGIQINHYDCFDRINELKVSQIIGINMIMRPVSQDMYGGNAKNGLIIITKK